MTNKPSDTGMNRTGVAMSPIDSVKTAEGAEAGGASAVGDTESILDVRVSWSSEADPVGTMPPPANIKGAVRVAANALKGEKMPVFLDLLAERLAFERTGTRLYEALMAKHGASDAHPGGPSAKDLRVIRDEEQAHFQMLAAALESLGGDPTAMTPSADITAVASMGLVQVLTDPRTTLTEGLKTILIAELADNDAWESLIEYAQALGHEQLVNQFSQALVDEAEHLVKVKTWVKNMVGGQLGVEMPARPANGIVAST